MRILFINEDPKINRGIPIYSVPLAQELSALGNEVHYAYSGAYLGKMAFKPCIKAYIDRGIHYHEVRSLSLAYNFNKPLLDITQPAIEAALSNLVGRLSPDIVHVHSMVGLPSASLVRLALAAVPIVTTFHEYWFLCPRRVLIRADGEPCNGPSPLMCAECTPDVSVFRNLVKNLAVTFGGPLAHRLLLNGYKFVRDLKDESTRRPQNEMVPPDCALNSKAIAHLLRLNFNIDLLNKFVRINIAVSDFVRRLFMQYGVKEDRIITDHIGTKAPSTITEKVPARKDRKFAFGYIGGLSHMKGVHVALKAFQTLDHDNVRFLVFGSGSPEYTERLRHLASGFPVEFRGAYAYETLTDKLSEVDCVVIPAICYDTSPQTVFEAFSARKPVVAARIGGIPDFVKDGGNGLLFRPGDEQDLAQKLKEIATSSSLYAALKAGIDRPKSTSANAKGLLDIYREAITKS